MTKKEFSEWSIKYQNEHPTTEKLCGSVARKTHLPHIWAFGDYFCPGSEQERAERSA